MQIATSGFKIGVEMQKLWGDQSEDSFFYWNEYDHTNFQMY